MGGEKRRGDKKSEEGASSYLNRRPPFACVCVCVDTDRECEGGEAYVASVTRSVNKSRVEGLNRALFCLIQIPPESTFILLIK